MPGSIVTLTNYFSQYYADKKRKKVMLNKHGNALTAGQCSISNGILHIKILELSNDYFFNCVNRAINYFNHALTR